MERKQNISLYRERLDKTLASHDLTNEETLKTLVKNQMLQSSGCGIEEYIDNVLEKRTQEVSNFLQMLKSASLSDDDGSKTEGTYHRSWKVKQDTEDCRIMYREGPEGTPLHTLLVEGYVDGPIDVCLCISWESMLYKKWWPQSSIPTFKVLSSECLQKVRLGEQISLVRMKVSWPLSAREALVHFFELEYFQDDLIVVLLNSISDLERIDRSIHGFSRDGIPDVQDVVRIDVVGGFAIQKVNAGRSYFRTIANVDLKLDFVPPSFINFVSRQIIGSGFRLYQKEVASVSKGDEDFGKALRDPLYARICEALYSDAKQKGSVEVEPVSCKNEPRVVSSQYVIKPMQVEDQDMDQKVFSDDHATESFLENNVATDYKSCGEIEEIGEEEIEKSGHLEQDHEEICRLTTDEIVHKCSVNCKKKVDISPKVKHALETLEKAISIVREHGLSPQTELLEGLGNERSVEAGKSAVKDSKPSEDSQMCSNSGIFHEVSKNKMVDRTPNEPANSSSSLCSRHVGSNSYSTEANHKKIVPTSLEEDIPNRSETRQTTFSSSNNETSEGPVSNKLINGNANGSWKNSPNKGRNKKLRFCCLHFISGESLSK
ncbi:hypothetical protein U1Q18_008024 [Sarracenia purpurea var. burkii]